MAWKRAKIAALALTLGFAAASAQAQEAVWRVENPEAAEVVPPYTGNLSPFPVRQKPVEEVIAPVVDPAEEEALSASQQQALQAASLLAEARETLRDPNAFRPDVSGVVVEAIVKGLKGPTILIGNEWLKKGATIQVPIVAADSVLNIVQRLEAIDPNLAAAVNGEVQERLTSAGGSELTIDSVGEDFIELVDNQGNKSVISFVKSGW